MLVVHSINVLVYALLCLCLLIQKLDFSETQTGERDATWAGMDQSVTTGSQRVSCHVTKQSASVSCVC